MERMTLKRQSVFIIERHLSFKIPQSITEAEQRTSVGLMLCTNMSCSLDAAVGHSSAV